MSAIQHFTIDPECLWPQLVGSPADPPAELRVLWRLPEPPSLCDCPLCTGARAEPPHLLGCTCGQCTQSRLYHELAWASPFAVNGCVCCGQGWISHTGAANVCPACWDKDLCRVCWERPGVVCRVCHLHLDTPLGDPLPWQGEAAP